MAVVFNFSECKGKSFRAYTNPNIKTRKYLGSKFLKYEKNQISQEKFSFILIVMLYCRESCMKNQILCSKIFNMNSFFKWSGKVHFYERLKFLAKSYRKIQASKFSLHAFSLFTKMTYALCWFTCPLTGSGKCSKILKLKILILSHCVGFLFLEGAIFFLRSDMEVRRDVYVCGNFEKWKRERRKIMVD